MKNYVIVTDSTCDLPASYIKENKLTIIPIPYAIGENIYGDGKNDMDIKEFYNAMRNGIMPTTMACNVADCIEAFQELAKAGVDILHLAFSSGLSSTYNNATLAAKEVMEEYPDCNIQVIDTLAASMGEGLLVHKAVMLKKEGKTLDEVKTWIEAHRQNIISRFTVDDLNHLHRGGRVSKTTAVVGSLINVKPILHVNEAGELKSLDKTRGRKKALMALVDHMEEATKAYDGTNDIAFISHGDCEDDAKLVAAEIKKRFGIDCMINILGQTIGTHTGPGLVALFFMGNKR